MYLVRQIANLVISNKCHRCLGSYNKTAEHAKQQGKGAKERSRAAGSRAGEQAGQGKQGNRAGSRARQQGRRHRAGERGRAARQQSTAAGEIQLAHGCTGQTFVNKYVHFLVTLCILAKINFQTAAEGQALIQQAD